MARTENVLHDHPRSKKARGEQEAKKGDREVDPDSGEEWESRGTDKDDDMDLKKAWEEQNYPRRVKTRKDKKDGAIEYWAPPKKTEIPTS